MALRLRRHFRTARLAGPADPDSVEATTATVTMTSAIGCPTEAGPAAVRATGGAETRHTEEVAAQGERHHPRQQEAEAALGPVGRQ